MADPATIPVARFTQGSTMRHVVEMTSTGAIGLMAIFFVDFLSLFYISRLDDDRLTAGVGYATTVLFLAISINIGSMIASSALVARAIGEGNREKAQRLATACLIHSTVLAAFVTIGLLAFLPAILDLVGAHGMPREVATRFLWITLPANVLMAIGMGFSGLLRALADPKRAMMVTLLGGIVTAFADPLLIFGFGLGTDGAAYATVIARIVYTVVGYLGVGRVHRLLALPAMPDFSMAARPFFNIAVPAILTNVATPIANLLLMRVLAPFGEAAIAANAILDRLVPVAFGVLFALSGAVGPILAQNLGARRLDRLRDALRDALIFALVYCLIAWLVLVLLRNQIGYVFKVEGETARYVAYFCMISGATWAFNGFLFVANAAFNNLGFPLYSTLFNWSRATLGTLPVALYGAQIAGVEGAMTGVALGSAVFGIAAVLVAFRVVGSIEART